MQMYFLNIEMRRVYLVVVSSTDIQDTASNWRVLRYERIVVLLHEDRTMHIANDWDRQCCGHYAVRV